MTHDAATIRNVAIISHVDHGKTTLVDALLRQSGVFREHEEIPERAMDSFDLERERGITIMAKNCSLEWENLLINIVDTPGHADFGGEVERILSMADGALLLVDAAEGPLPQTRFVLRKALEAGLSVVVLINKIDRQDARPESVRDEIFDLFIDCDAGDDHLECPVIYSIARKGLAAMDLDAPFRDMRPVFEAIRDHIPPPAVEAEAPFSMLVANLGYSDYVGRLAIGRIRSGSVAVHDVVLVASASETRKSKVTRIQGYRGLETEDRQTAAAGEIISLAGFSDVFIGDTITSVETPVIQPRIEVDAPTVEMLFAANTSPFSGREGRFVTSRQLKDRLRKEAQRNVSLRLREAEEGDGLVVAGRGELQFSILIETLRREGYEMEVSLPKVIEREENGTVLEPHEEVLVEMAEEHIGAVTELFSARKGLMTKMDGAGSGRVRLTFRIPSRGLFGIRSKFLTQTRGTGVMHSLFDGYSPRNGKIPSRTTGALIADRVTKATAHAISNLEARGSLFVSPGDEAYAGMIVGEHSKDRDVEVHIGRPKKLTNIRAAGSDEAVQLIPPLVHTLESAMEWINDDELIEVTPQSIRIRKRLLDPGARKDLKKAEDAGKL